MINPPSFRSYQDQTPAFPRTSIAEFESPSRADTAETGSLFFMNRSLFSSQSVHWATPEGVFKTLDSEFHFDLDPCPLRAPAAPLESWSGRRVFCNPPYGREMLPFIAKATEADLAVFLIPARTDTKWFHDTVLSKAKEIRFIRGRLKFGGSANSAPFPSMIVIFRK